MGDASDSPVLDSATAEQLNNVETRRLLDTIDSLRDLHIGGIVDLPQIIVVGDQCSGKSSVLEAISRVHFPVSDGICTRFPTELVLRRAPKESTDLRIRFASDPPADGKDASPTRTPFHESNFNRSELPAIINRAKEHMGLGDGKTTGFSKHVLRVEIAGPDIPSLTLVDLPGIFHSGVSSQPQEWKPVVDDMVENYMKQKNSIILMVVSADISLSKHAILDITIKHDAPRERTIGVITKVDLCPGSNLEDEYLRLARGQEPNHQLRLGWHVIRNRGPKETEVDFDQRDVEEEKFLKTGVWSTLPLASRGVDSLRKSLGATLLKQIRSSLPEVIRDIDANLQNRQKRLAKLGTTRTNPDEMRDYLLTVSTTFHRLAEHAVEGRYNDLFFATPTVKETARVKFRKLRALLRNLNRAFDITMRTKGATYQIEWDQEQSNSDTDDGEDELANIPDYLQPFLQLYDFPDPAPKSQSVIKDTIERLASASQGVEFPGLPNSDLIMQLFRDQSEPWRRIAECHMNIVTERTRLFVYHLFDYVLEDDKRTRDAILAECVDPSFESMTEVLRSKLSEILRPYTSGHGLPLELEFRTGLSKRKVSRMAAQIVNLLDRRDSVAYGTSEYQILKHEDVKNIIIEANSGNVSDFGTDIVIDMMLTHYEMSIRTFTDNVVHLVLENCLVSKLPDIFSTRVVAQMGEEILKRLAEESDEVKLERSQLLDEVDKLRTGLQNCQRSRPRDFSELPDNFIELAPRTEPPRTEPPKKSRIRVKLPPVQNTTTVKQEQDSSTSKGKAPIIVPNGETSLKQEDGKIAVKSEPVTAPSSLSNSGQSTTAESSRQQAPDATSSSTGQSSTAGQNKNGTESAFGGLNTTSTPASSSAFGSSPATQTPVIRSAVFGGTATTPPAPTATPFGSAAISSTPSPKPSFGSTAAPVTTAAELPSFGSRAPTVIGPSFGQAPGLQPSYSAFGPVSALQNAGSTTTIAAAGSTPSAFGSNKAATVTGSSFGQVSAIKPSTSPFGQVSALQPSVSTPSAFGSTTSAAGLSPFGSNKAPTVTGPSFGQTPAPQPTTSAFGSVSALQNAKLPAAGTTTTATAFGTNATPTTATAAFGSSAVQNPPVTSSFGKVAPIGATPSTALAPFEPYFETELGGFGSGIVSYQNILFQFGYRSWSIDELRLVDYERGRRVPPRSTASFGVPAASQPEAAATGGLFGVKPSPAPATGGGLFGGSKTTSSSPQTEGGLVGGSGTTSSSPSPATGSLFGKAK
ncbi:hypothetical protein V8C42DRAFT_316823 [Trichoderma barbatum]